MSYTYPSQPILWKRFIDDNFVIWHHGLSGLQQFIDHWNLVQPTIQFTSEISSHQIAFLDLEIYVKGHQLHINLYTKPTDRHMYLSYIPKHPPSLTKYFVFINLYNHGFQKHFTTNTIKVKQLQAYIWNLICDTSYFTVWVQSENFPMKWIHNEL